MKYYSDPLVQDILSSRRLSNLHNTPYASVKQIIMHHQQALKLRSLAFREVGAFISNYILSKWDSYKEAQLIKKNILELQNLSDHILKDIGISRDEIRPIVKDAYLKETDADKNIMLQNVRFLKFEEAAKPSINKIMNQEISYQKCG